MRVRVRVRVRVRGRERVRGCGHERVRVRVRVRVRFLCLWRWLGVGPASPAAGEGSVMFGRVKGSQAGPGNGPPLTRPNMTLWAGAPVPPEWRLDKE